MEVPDFCKKPAPRKSRRSKTEIETDPDFAPPEPPSSSSKASGSGKKVRRSRKLEDSRKKLPLGLNYIERREYTVEDWKKKAVESRKTRMITRAAKSVADHLKDADPEMLAKIGLPEKLETFGSTDPYRRYYDGEMDDSGDEEVKFNYEQLPKYVMGTGKGTVGGPPAFDSSSLWNYDLDTFTPSMDNEPIVNKYPWEIDPSKPDVTPEIVTIVAGFTVGCKLDLEQIANGSRNVEYNPDRFAPLIMRIRNPKSTGLIFRTGRIMVAGTRSEDECKRAARKYARIIQKFGYKVGVLDLNIQNILASCTLKFKVRLHQLSRNKEYGTLSYEPELFPGLVIPLEHPKVKIIIFCTGSVILTGSKSEEDLHEAFKKVYPLVRMYAP